MKNSRKPVALSSKWLEHVRSFPESGMGYHIVTVTLNDKRIFKQAVVDAGRITKVRGYTEIPFHEEEIADIDITHERWDWSVEN